MTERELAIAQYKLIQNLIDLTGVSKISGTFIKAFLKAIPKADGMHYLHGNFNQGGTVSGRLSSSGPNLTNLPSGSEHAEVVKQCFKPPPGWLWMGIDYNSLEDMISALTTRDPNKLKVYEDGYDGHSLRTFNYFREQLPDITDTVESINSIEDKYPILRQASKGPTFALTYGGTFHALVNQCGLSVEDAKRIEKEYHTLYAIADQWVADKLKGAAQRGYITAAFGLRVRTPILQQILLGKRSTPYEGKAESRTAGNALGQSYGLLNIRSSIEFQQRLLESNQKYNIRLICQIHDSQYYLVRDCLGTIKWFNDNIVECIQWQELAEIKHPTVKLGGSVEIFHPSWNEHFKIPNFATNRQILDAAEEFKAQPAVA